MALSYSTPYIRSTCVYLLWEMAWAYWACPTFASSWVHKFVCCYFLSIGPLGLISFSSFLLFFFSLGFFNPLFLPLLTNLLLYSFFTCYWAFLLLEFKKNIYIKNGHQQTLKYSIIWFIYKSL